MKKIFETLCFLMIIYFSLSMALISDKSDINIKFVIGFILCIILILIIERKLK